MQLWAQSLSDLARELAPVMVVFALLALAVKRRAIVAALRRSHRETMTNLGLVALNGVLLAPFILVPKAWLEAQVGLIPELARMWDAAPAASAGPAAFLLAEFTIYWRHRLEHHRAWWPIHAVHHSDETITWLTLLRKHPLAKLLSAVFDHLPLLLVGLPLWSIALAAVIRSWWGFFIHADVPWTLGPLGKVLMSPAAHRLHHIDDLEKCGANYGNTLTLWDRLFGTYVDPARYLNCRTGVCGGSRGLIGELARPFSKDVDTELAVERAPART
jgi:sterol desaturase/sphingolipid hydroxylase (fatty acid hydroxylase superfamily)